MGQATRECLAEIGLAALMDRADDVGCKRFRTRHSAFVFNAALSDTVVAWEKRLARTDASTVEQVERKWMGTGALIYLEKNCPDEAHHLVARWERDFTAGPEQSCSAQAQADALLIGYVLLRTSDESRRAGVAAAAWEWHGVSKSRKVPPPNLEDPPLSATADALMREVIVLQLLKEVTYARLRKPAFLSAIASEEIRDAAWLALSAVARLIGSDGFRKHQWSLDRLEIELRLAMYLVSNSFEDLVPVWSTGYKQLAQDALKFITEHFGAERVDLQHTVKTIAAGGELALRIYRRYEQGKHLESGDSDLDDLWQLFAPHTVDALRSAIEAALALLATSSKGTHLIDQFWSCLLRLLLKSSGNPYWNLRSAIEGLPPELVPTRVREALQRFQI